MKGILWQKQSNTPTSKVLAIQKRVASSTWNIEKTSRALELGHWETSRALELGHWETSRVLELGLSETADRALEWYFAEIMTGNIFILHKTLMPTWCIQWVIVKYATFAKLDSTVTRSVIFIGA